MQQTVKTHKPLQCSHVESGACPVCKDPMKYHAPKHHVATRTASVRKDTKFAPKTDPVLKMFMKENEAERSRTLSFAKGHQKHMKDGSHRPFRTSDLLFS